MKKVYFLLLLIISSKMVSQTDTSIVKFRNPASVSMTKGYSHSAEIDLGNCKMLMISGQIALDSKGTLIGKDNVAEQTEQIFTNIKNIVAESGGSMNDVVKLGIYMIDIAQVQAMRDVRDKFFSQKELPASTLVQVSKLVRDDVLLEIEATAIIPKKAKKNTANR